jgi:prevent-host-death family protein
MRSWQLQEAKARLSELVKHARTEGPQDVTVRGESAVVVLSREHYDRLTRPKPSLVELMRASPLRGARVDVRREQTRTREVRL